MSTQSQGTTFPPCELCGGSQVGNLSVKSHQHVGAHPNGKSLWSAPLTRLSVVACLNCGHAKLFASDLDALRNEASEHPERFSW